MKTKTKLLSALVVASLMLPSCATLFTGTRDTIHFDSYPQGATVQIKTLDKGITPCDVRVNRTIMKKQVTYKLDGYESKTFELEKRFNAVSLLNLLAGVFIAYGIDCATGAVIKYDPKLYKIQLTNIDPSKKVIVIAEPEKKPIDEKQKTTSDVKADTKTHAPAVTNSSKLDRLKELDAMLDAKLITKKDYKTQKDKILAE